MLIKAGPRAGVVEKIEAKLRQRAPALGEGMVSKQVCIAVCFAVVLVPTLSVFVEGLPILGPDLNSCKPVIPPTRTAADAIDCCFVDTSRPIKDFKFNLDLPMRVRRPAHKLDDEFIRKYERAMELMRALPPEDPRSFKAQSVLHCSYCSAAYNRFNSSTALSVHMGWFVLPFHRWYLYFHERILASLIGDDTFAIPYWAWDVQNEHNPPANIMPPIYVNKNSSLYDENRSKLHQPPGRVDLQYPSPVGNRDPEELLNDNYYNLWRSMIGQVQTPEAFYGGKVSLEDEYIQVGGVLESGPHGAVHGWTGDPENPNGEDMHPAYSAARDPIFFAHHSQVDRLWWIWKNWGGQDYDDPDWLDSEFLLYDENADLVRINVRDSLKFENFRVTYEQVDSDWMNYTPKSIRDMDPKYARASIPKRFWREVVIGGMYRSIPFIEMLGLGNFVHKETNGVKLSLGGVRRAAVTSQVCRTKVLRSQEDSLVYDEVLLIMGVVEKPFNVSVLIKIFMELPEADENTIQHCVEFLGGVVVDAEGLRDRMNLTVARKFSKTIGIRDTLQILGITRQQSLDVTFVPAWDPKHDADVSVRVTVLKAELKRAR